MFAAVLAASALFMLAAATGSSTAVRCTASLPTVVVREGGDECPTSGQDEIVNEINQNVSTLLQEVLRCKMGNTPENPADSCAEIAEQKPDSPSGDYWILNSAGSPVQVYCEMGDVFPANLNATGRWIRVSKFEHDRP